MADTLLQFISLNVSRYQPGEFHHATNPHLQRGQANFTCRCHLEPPTIEAGPKGLVEPPQRKSQIFVRSVVVLCQPWIHRPFFKSIRRCSPNSYITIYHHLSPFIKFITIYHLILQWYPPLNSRSGSSIDPWSFHYPCPVTINRPNAAFFSHGAGQTLAFLGPWLHSPDVTALTGSFSSFNGCGEIPQKFELHLLPIGSMVLLYMVTFIPSIYPLYVSIYIYIYHTWILWVIGKSPIATGWLQEDNVVQLVVFDSWGFSPPLTRMVPELNMWYPLVI